MTAPRISDHALLRFLERVAGIDVEAVREELGAGLARAHAAAVTLGGPDHLILADGHAYVVRGGTVTTVVEATSRHSEAAILTGQRNP